jgi:hypothetical protein
MKSLAELPAETARNLEGILFDLDDTFLSHGVLEREAYDALWDLHRAGLGLVVVTGRPSGWGEVIVRQWPIDAAITENGAVYVTREDGIVDGCSAEVRAERAMKLRELVRDVANHVPEAKLSDDVHLRRTDITWDIGERETLPACRIRAVIARIQQAGARHTASSVHLHATFECEDKASGAVRVLRAVKSTDAGSALSRWAFIGDSGNDRACFAAFNVTFGVANVRQRIASLSLPPKWVSRAEMGKGFAEISRAILAARGLE